MGRFGARAEHQTLGLIKFTVLVIDLHQNAITAVVLVLNVLGADAQPSGHGPLLVLITNPGADIRGKPVHLHDRAAVGVLRITVKHNSPV